MATIDIKVYVSKLDITQNMLVGAGFYLSNTETYTKTSHGRLGNMYSAMYAYIHPDGTYATVWVLRAS